MIKDFKEFIARGNLMDLAIGFIMGAAFSTVVKSFTEGLIMPIVGLVTGGSDLKSKFYDLSGKLTSGATAEQITAAKEAGAPLLMYGQFISDIINFLIVGLVMFFLAKYTLKLLKGLEPAAAGPSAEETLLTEIRDLLKNKK
jgi:large conductance mechanosensitive channel